MKKLMALFIVLIMLGTCSSSYGLFLVLKASSSVKGVDDVAGTPITVKLNAYLVMNFTDEGSFLDANLIIYGKDANGAKVYLQLNDSDSNDFLDIAMTVVGYPVPYYVIALRTYGEDNPYEFETYVMGKMKAKDIGFGPEELWMVPSSLKGVFTSWYDMLLDKDQDIYGTGSMSMKLDDSITRLFNSQGRTQEKAVEDVIDILQGKDYSPGQAELRVRQGGILTAGASVNLLRKK